MARLIDKLSAAKVKSAGPGLHSDGGNLYLQVSPKGAKSWSFRFMLNGRSREMGLGPVHTIGLAEARSKAAEVRKTLLEGVDPIEVRQEAQCRGRIWAEDAEHLDDDTLVDPTAKSSSRSGFRLGQSATHTVDGLWQRCSGCYGQ